MNNSNQARPVRTSHFQFNDFKVRTVTKSDGSIWFVANDICNALEYKNTTKALNDHVLSDERTNYWLGRQGKVNIINESGLYSLCAETFPHTSPDLNLNF